MERRKGNGPDFAGDNGASRKGIKRTDAKALKRSRGEFLNP
jgi:hypothetical protein